RSKRDWSSDVCSSDLTFFLAVDLLYRYLVDPDTSTYWDLLPGTCLLLASYYFYDTEGVVNIPLYLRQAHLELMFSEDNMYMTERSEERRVGKVCRGQI